MENSHLSEKDWPSFTSEVSDQRLLIVVAVISHCNLAIVAGNNSLLHWMTTDHAVTSAQLCATSQITSPLIYFWTGL